MDFVVGNSALRSFYRFLQALHKVGDELFIEPRSTKLALSTVNPSRSAFALFTVSADFFESFLGPLPQVGAGSTTASQSSRRADQDCTLDSTSTSSASPIAYKVLLKTVTNIFKQKTNLDVIEKCRIHLDTGGETETGAQRIVIQLLCKYGIKKTHKLHFETCDSVQALYSKTQCQNRWTVAPKIVHDWLSFFSNRLEEVTFKCGADWVVMKSFSEDSPDAEKRSLQTELTLDPEDFDLFHVADVTDVTFSMKDFKSVLNLAEALAQPIAAYFNGPGQPLTLSISQMNIFTADFVLATFSESALTQSSSRPALSPREETRQPAPSQTVSNGGEDHRMDDQPRVEPAYPQSEGQRTPAAKPTYRPGISVFASSPSPADPSKHQTLRDSPHYQPDHPGSHRLGLYNLSPDVGPAGSAFNRSLHASLPRMSTPGHQLFQRTDQQTYTSSRSYGQITLPRPASSVPKVVEEDDLPAGQHRPDRARAPSTGILPSHDQRQNDGFGAFKHKLMACDSMDVDEVPTECERVRITSPLFDPADDEAQEDPYLRRGAHPSPGLKRQYPIDPTSGGSRSSNTPRSRAATGSRAASDNEGDYGAQLPPRRRQKVVVNVSSGRESGTRTVVVEEEVVPASPPQASKGSSSLLVQSTMRRFTGQTKSPTGGSGARNEKSSPYGWKARTIQVNLGGEDDDEEIIGPTPR